MAITLKSLHAASLASALLLTTVVKMSGMSPQIKSAFLANVTLAREMLIASDEPDSFLAEFELSAQSLLREI